MRFRKLRIAWSVFWGLACILLMAWWVRSYWVIEVLGYASGTQSDATMRSIASDHGTLIYVRAKVSIAKTDISFTGWKYQASRFHIATDRRFYWKKERNFSVLQFPTWLPVIALAPVAWFPWSGLQWKFSLRTLLIATTLVAMVLGLIVWMWQTG